jgi:hypothetical protein
MNRNDSLPFGEKKDNSRVEFSHMPELEKVSADGFGQGRPVVFPLPNFGHPGHDYSKVVRVCFLQPIEEFPERGSPRARLIEFYLEFHISSTSILMYLPRSPTFPINRFAASHGFVKSPFLPLFKRGEKWDLPPQTSQRQTSL